MTSICCAHTKAAVISEWQITATKSNAQVMAHGIPTDSSNDKQNTGYLRATEMKKRFRARLSWVLQQYAVIKENQMAGQV